LTRWLLPAAGWHLDEATFVISNAITEGGSVAGQVGGALMMDVLVPTPGAVVGWQTAVGGTLTVLALILASASGLRRVLRRES
jgi:bacterial/archaeal transporter family-2 protein